MKEETEEEFLYQMLFFSYLDLLKSSQCEKDPEEQKCFPIQTNSLYYETSPSLNESKIKLLLKWFTFEL